MNAAVTQSHRGSFFLHLRSLSPQSAELYWYLLCAGARSDCFGPRVKRAALRTCQLWKPAQSDLGPGGDPEPSPGRQRRPPSGKN